MLRTGPEHGTSHGDVTGFRAMCVSHGRWPPAHRVDALRGVTPRTYDRAMTPRLSRPAHVVLAAGIAIALLSTACAPEDDDSTSTAPKASGSSSASPTEDACAKESLETHTPGTLTITTDKPAYPPWFEDDDPANGKGYEGAVAAAVAEQLGFTPDEVTWTRTKFDAAIAPGPKDWDFDINQFSITEERKQAVDFSSPYYDVTQAVVTTGGSKAAKATSLADLKSLKIGAQVGTTSYDAIISTIDPDQKPAVYNSNDDAKQALENGQVDAIVTDLPTAFYITAAELSNGKIVGQLPSGSGEQEQFGLVLDKGSPLTACVSAAVDELRADGTLEELVDEWLSRAGGAPVLS
jgi:polar amino acid transport system substrate-binding protein